MTGRDMISYIRRQKLEDEELFDPRGVPKGLLGTVELGRKLGVSESTVRVWLQRDKIRSVVRIAGRHYFYPETESPDPKKRGRK